jgi:hypothetical protein
MLRTADEPKRREMLRKETFLAAALEAPGELSGLADSLHSGLRAEAVERRYPELVQSAKEFAEAAETAQAALRVAEMAIDAELEAAGPEPKAAIVKPWLA